jgi:hypothetical protein
LRWFATAAVVGFAVPFVGSSLLELQHDVYLGIYFVAGLALWSGVATGYRLLVRLKSLMGDFVRSSAAFSRP